MTVVPITTISTNEKKKVRATVYFYATENGNTTDVISDATVFQILVKEELYIKRLVDNPFIDDDTIDQNRSINSMNTGTTELIPNRTIILEQNDDTSLTDVILSLIDDVSKNEDIIRHFSLTFQNPNEFPDYVLSEDLIIAIFEKFNYVEFNLGSYNTPTFLPSRQFKNDYVSFKNCSFQAEGVEFFGRLGVEVSNCIFNRKDIDKNNYITFSSNVSVKTSYITLQSVIYIKCNVRTETESQFKTSAIEVRETTVTIDDDETIPIIKDALVGVSGSKTIMIDNFNVNCDIPGYRVVSIDSCESFSVSDYIHKRTNRAFTQDFIISKFMEGVFIDVTIEGPTQYALDRSNYAILCSSMRMESKLKFNNFTCNRYGVLIATFANFNELSFINSNISDTSKVFDFSSSVIRKIILNSTNIKTTDILDLAASELKIISSTLDSSDNVLINIDTSFNGNESSIFCNAIEYYARENSSSNFKSITIKSKSSILISGKRPESTKEKSETISLDTVKFEAASIIIKDMLTLICNTVSIYKIPSITFSDLSLQFSDLSFDYDSTLQDVKFTNCKIVDANIEFNNAPARYAVAFDSCSGNASFTYYSELTSICRQEISLINSPVDMVTDDVYGSHLIYIKSKGSVGARYIATEELSISPDTVCDDKLLFAKATAANDINNKAILYGIIVEE